MQKCKHGSSRDQGFTGAWNGPFGICSCCGKTFVYTESGGWFSTPDRPDGKYFSKIWYPKDKCSSCGGEYVEHSM